MNREDRMRNLLELRSMLKTRIDELEKELLRLRSMLDALDDILLEATITTADRLTSPAAVPEEVAKVEERQRPPAPQEVEEMEILSGEERIGRILVNRARGILILEVERDVRADSGPIGRLTRRLRELRRSLSGVAYNVEAEEGALRRIVVRGVPPGEMDRLVNEVRWAIDRAYRNP
ncbi:MAG: hypothetical protein DRO01_01600 [Thermoproteota archaeon]|nr:MAG: hypothetical protein DRO01_01600 [Candidatus Korarchaeota archaeon]